MDELTRDLVAARDGDRLAFAAVVRHGQADVWRLCAHLVGRQEADDLTQDTFVRVVRAAPGVSWRLERVRTWLLAIARRACADAIRRNVRSTAPRCPAAGAGAETALADPAPSRAVDALLARARRRPTTGVRPHATPRAAPTPRPPRSVVSRSAPSAPASPAPARRSSRASAPLTRSDPALSLGTKPPRMEFGYSLRASPPSTAGFGRHGNYSVDRMQSFGGGALVRVRGIVGGLVAATAVLVLAAPASAHVTVNPSEASQGGFDEAHVPGAERARRRGHRPRRGQHARRRGDPVRVGASRFPGGPPTSTTPHARRAGRGRGRRDHRGRRQDHVDAAGRSSPVSSRSSSISAGPLPDDVDELEFPAIQTYDER